MNQSRATACEGRHCVGNEGGYEEEELVDHAAIIAVILNEVKDIMNSGDSSPGFRRGKNDN
ncbi:MAG: hypothetical protein DHS20C02_04310 [Micavibrio sp.]|nr:MAG: hypothetical protein DHS20C02_04310 [Micavibrio sp.]